MTKSKVLVGMSGGVDSSVSAALLIEQGYEVIGAFMKNWSNCDWRTDQRDATRVAAKLGIPFVTFDFEKEYREAVVDDMFREFEAGRTPNPDVLCNKYIKFDLFVREAERLGCAFVATGHYARSIEGKLFAGMDLNKDQSYFLWAMPPQVVSRVLFPIGEMTKPHVREKAHELGLEVADKKDSTGICFVGEVDMRTFLQERLPKTPGNVVTVDGNVIGTHEGLAFYTLGQREGLGIGGGTPYYVVEKRSATNELVVASNFHPMLYRSDLTASKLNWFEKPSWPFPCKARIRYRQELQDCTVLSSTSSLRGAEGDEAILVSFNHPQRAVTPGQSIVFYDAEKVLGGGIIE
ncbi:MAG: tRNA 2-thiouridine(34) synthase MnmA [Patescibacteria group bacterium]